MGDRQAWSESWPLTGWVTESMLHHVSCSFLLLSEILLRGGATQPRLALGRALHLPHPLSRERRGQLARLGQRRGVWGEPGRKGCLDKVDRARLPDSSGWDGG